MRTGTPWQTNRESVPENARGCAQTEYGTRTTAAARQSCTPTGKPQPRLECGARLADRGRVRLGGGRTGSSTPFTGRGGPPGFGRRRRARIRVHAVGTGGGLQREGPDFGCWHGCLLVVEGSAVWGFRHLSPEQLAREPVEGHPSGSRGAG